MSPLFPTKCVRITLLAALAMPLACATTSPPGGSVSSVSTAEDERVIRAIMDHQTRAWNAADASGHARDIADDAVFTNILGQSFAGRESFIRQHEVIFQSLFRNTTAGGDITVLRFPARDVALVETLTAVTGLVQMPPGVGADRQGRLRTRLLQVLVRRDGQWKVVAYHNVDVKPIVQLPEPSGQ